MQTIQASDEPALSLAEWVALCLVCEQPTHGFAVAGLLIRGSDLGQMWHIQKAVVYRAMDRLERLGYIRRIGQEFSSLGPVKSPCRAIPSGQRAAAAWLNRPVDHPRDIRPELLPKLALLDRIGADSAELLGRQHPGAVAERVDLRGVALSGCSRGADLRLLSLRLPCS